MVRSRTDIVVDEAVLGAVDDTPFCEVGDALFRVGVIVELEVELGIDISDAEAENIQTVADLRRLAQEKAAAS